MGGGKSGCVSVEDDCNVMITTSTNSEQDNIFDCCQELQFYIVGAKLERDHFMLDVFRTSPLLCCFLQQSLVLSPATKDDTHERHLTHCIVT